MYDSVPDMSPGTRPCARCQNPLTAEAAFCGACGSPAPPLPRTEPRERPLRTGEVVLIELISWLPPVNLIAWLVWMLRPACVQRARIAQAKLIVSCILLAGVSAVILLMAALISGGVLETLPLPSLEWP